jgi:hypothetical protein
MPMSRSLEQQIGLLPQMTAAELHGKYQEMFGELPRSCHKAYLVRRIAWRLQAVVEGDLSERARRRAAELACDADLRISAPPSANDKEPWTESTAAGFSSDRRRNLPPPGTVLARPYQGRIIEVTILAQGFQCQDRVYRSLSAVAKAVTGKHWNGYHFFGLRKPIVKAAHA